MQITNYEAKCNRFNHQTSCAGAFQCISVHRDCCSVTRDRLGTLLSRCGKGRGTKGAPRCIRSLFVSRRSPARQKELTTLPPTIPSTVRTVSVSQVGSRRSFYNPGISYFRRRRRRRLIIVVVVVVIAFALFLAGGRLLDFLSRFFTISLNNFIVEWLSTMLNILSSKRNVCNIAFIYILDFF